MFIIVRKEKDKYQGLAVSNSYDEAQNKMLEEAQKISSFQVSTKEGTYLVKKGKTIEEFRNIAKNVDKGWVFAKKSKEIINELVAEYMIIELLNNKELDNKLIVPDKTEEDFVIIKNFDESKGESKGEPKDESKGEPKDECEDKFLAKIIVLIDQNKSMSFGLIDKYDQSCVRECTWEEINSKVSEIYKLEASEESEAYTIDGSTNNLTKLYEKKLEIVKKLVDLLSENRAINYKKWKDVGMALHSIDNNLLDCFIHFSRKYAYKYSVYETFHLMTENCEKEWKSFKNNCYNISNLHEWAMEDNPNEYQKIFGNN